MRNYDEMCTGGWLDQEAGKNSHYFYNFRVVPTMLQIEARHRETVVPLMFVADDTRLTNYSDDKKASPLYITIGNIPAPEKTK